MADCKFYELEFLISDRNPITDTRRPGRARRIEIPWCSHLKSQVPKYIALAPAGGNALKCGGDMSEGMCPIWDKL